MSDQETPAPAPVQPPVKRLSGLLMFSVVSSVAGFLLIPVLLPALGLILAWLGYKKVKADPTLIGPRFAVGSMIFAALCTLGSAYVMYRNLPQIMFQQSLIEKHNELMTALGGREYERAWKVLDHDLRRSRDLETFTAEMKAAFPGEEKIVFSEETLEGVEDEELTKRIQEDLRRFFEEDGDEVRIPSSFTVAHGGGKVRMDVEYLVRRQGYVTFDVRLVGISTERQEPEEPPEDPAGGTAGSSAEENPR